MVLQQLHDNVYGHTVSIKSDQGILGYVKRYLPLNMRKKLLNLTFGVT